MWVSPVVDGDVLIVEGIVAVGGGGSVLKLNGGLITEEAEEVIGVVCCTD